MNIETKNDKLTRRKTMSSELIKKAEQGDAESQFNLGLDYSFGDAEVPLDADKALLWYGKAFNNPNASDDVKVKAALRTAFLYSSDSKAFIKHDWDKLLYWLGVSAELGSVKAAQTIVDVLMRPDYPNADSDLFIKWLKKLAYDYKEPAYMLELAGIYSGEPVNPMYFMKWPNLANLADLKEAYRLCKEAADIAKGKEKELLHYSHCEIIEKVYHKESRRMMADNKHLLDDVTKSPKETLDLMNSVIHMTEKKLYFAEMTIDMMKAAGESDVWINAQTEMMNATKETLRNYKSARDSFVEGR
jgi:TPR repeat protein